VNLVEVKAKMRVRALEQKDQERGSGGGSRVVVGVDFRVVVYGVVLVVSCVVLSWCCSCRVVCCVVLVVCLCV